MCWTYRGASDDSDDRWLIGIVFDFRGKLLIFRAEGDDDTISAHECDSLGKWISSQEDGSELQYEKSKHLNSLIGQPLADVWECQSGQAYIDAVDFCFGDLLSPSLKIWCEGSRLHLFSIEGLDNK